MPDVIAPRYYRLACSTCGTIWQLRCLLRPGELAPVACNYWEGTAEMLKLPCGHWQHVMGVAWHDSPPQFLSAGTKVL